MRFDWLAWLRTSFEESTGKASSRRLASVLLVITFVIAFFAVTVKTWTLQDVPAGWGILLGFIVGAASAVAVLGKGEPKP